ncbi:MAG: hypothetical protein H6811_01390 [Phycisphaeraceae bacterium]|nr:hypothetical protein [Phycisphaeraceae bacterium]
MNLWLVALTLGLVAVGGVRFGSSVGTPLGGVLDVIFVVCVLILLGHFVRAIQLRLGADLERRIADTERSAHIAGHAASDESGHESDD